MGEAFRTARGSETRVLTFDEMLAQVAAGRGTFETVQGCHDDVRTSSSERNPRPLHCDGAVSFCGFSLHAPVRIAADDRGRERLFRYCLRPLFSLDRLHLLTDGRYGYTVKKCGRRASRGRNMTPVECLARLCALVPPAYYPSTRFQGVIAPRARLRKAIVDQPPRDVRPYCSAKRCRVAARESKNRDARAAPSVCARQEDEQLVIAPADARSHGEAPGKPCGGFYLMAFESSGRREDSTSCANGQALLQLDSSPSPHGCRNPLPTAHRPIGARVITNAEMTTQNAEMGMQKWENAHAAIGAVVLWEERRRTGASRRQEFAGNCAS